MRIPVDVFGEPFGAERDSRIFELEFWAGREKRNGSFDDITRILTDMRSANARAQVQAISPQYSLEQRGLPYTSSFAYPANGKTRLIVPSEREMEESWLQQIFKRLESKEMITTDEKHPCRCCLPGSRNETQ